jgi:hypothetical protein
VELAGRGLTCCAVAEPGETGVPAALRVSLEVAPCAADVEKVLVEVSDGADGRVVVREVALSDVAQTARPRALALAVAELMRSLGQQPAPDEPPPPVAVVVTPPPPSPPAAPVRAIGLSLQVEGEVRALPARSTTVWGGRARVTAPWRWLHADLDVGGGFASAGSDLGEVLLRTASVGLWGGPRLASRIAIVDLGLRGELGWAWIRGEPNSSSVRGGSGGKLLASLGLRAAAALPAALSLRPCLAVEGGGVLAGLDGQAGGRGVLGVGGYYVLAALGIGVVP